MNFFWCELKCSGVEENASQLVSGFNSNLLLPRDLAVQKQLGLLINMSPQLNSQTKNINIMTANNSAPNSIMSQNIVMQPNMMMSPTNMLPNNISSPNFMTSQNIILSPHKMHANNLMSPTIMSPKVPIPAENKKPTRNTNHFLNNQVRFIFLMKQWRFKPATYWLSIEYMFICFCIGIQYWRLGYWRLWKFWRNFNQCWTLCFKFSESFSTYLF